jgi:DNA-binding transcriptional MerR regulator
LSECVPQLLTLAALAKAFCVSPHTVRGWVKKGRLRPIRLCRRLLFHPDEIAHFLALNSSGNQKTADSSSKQEPE